MKGLLGMMIAGVLCAPPQLPARDLADIYDRSTLEYWGQRYQRSTLKILNDVILPVLKNEEKQRLGGLPRIDFPLHAEGDLKGRPLMFYVPGDHARVVMPVFSLKFLDDLCTAYAWLQVNGYSLETISEYTAMLRYGKFSGGRYPPPLKALQIPDRALEDKRVDELALGHFVTARTWLLLHELGHMYFRHRATSYEQSRRNEEQADRFAAQVMRRTPLPPLGIIVFFMADASWAGYPSNEYDTHRLSGQRLRLLAGQVDDPGLAGGLQKLGEFLDDPDIRTGFAATGRAADASTLAPRRRGELPGAVYAKPRGTREGSALAFHGRYVGEMTQFGGAPEPFSVEVVLQRRGDRVNGRYNFGLGTGTVEGIASSDALHFEWTWAGNAGRGVLKSSSDGTAFSGTWGYRRAVDNAGTWKGRRAD